MCSWLGTTRMPRANSLILATHSEQVVPCCSSSTKVFRVWVALLVPLVCYAFLGWSRDHSSILTFHPERAMVLNILRNHDCLHGDAHASIFGMYSEFHGMR